MQVVKYVISVNSPFAIIK